MDPDFHQILIISDIEGSSGCWTYSDSVFLDRGWPQACIEMTRDVDAVGKALLDAGVEQVIVKDFHRTGYNLLPERLDPRIHVVQGYRQGPVPGIGTVENIQAVMFIGMHAASGSDGFLPHTLTSRIDRLVVRGRLIAEVELFSASLAPFNIKPIFFSGCPVACSQAKEAIPGIETFSIDKSAAKEAFRADGWRKDLASAAASSLENRKVDPYSPPGSFHAVVTMKEDPKRVAKIARSWGLEYDGMRIFVPAADIHELYRCLVRICYLTPWIEKTIPLMLPIYNFKGRLGLHWVRRIIGKTAG